MWVWCWCGLGVVTGMLYFEVTSRVIHEISTFITYIFFNHIQIALSCSFPKHTLIIFKVFLVVEQKW